MVVFSFRFLLERCETLDDDDILFEFDNYLASTLSTHVRSGRRGISRFLSFPFLSVGRSIKENSATTTTTTTTTRPSGGATGASSVHRFFFAFFFFFFFFFARENQLLEFRVSLVDQKTFVVQSTFFGGTDRPFRFFYLRLLFFTNKKKQTFLLINFSH